MEAPASEELRIGPDRRRRGPSMIIAVIVVVASAAVVTAMWLSVPRDPALTLDQVRASYEREGRIGDATARWTRDALAVRDWAAATRVAGQDCSRLSDGSDPFEDSPFAVLLRPTRMTRDDGAAVFAGAVGTFGYPDVAAASVALTEFGELVDRCAGTDVDALFGCRVEPVVVSPSGRDARSRFTTVCSGFSNVTVTDIVQVGNTLTVLRPEYGIDQESVDRTAEVIRRSLREA